MASHTSTFCTGRLVGPVTCQQLLRRCGLLLFLLACALPVWAGGEQHRYFSGGIGERYTIQADLRLTHGVVEGTYFYESSMGKPLRLKGMLSAEGNARLNETDEDGRRTGAFTGHFSADFSRFSGTWSSADGKRHLPVALVAVADYRTLATTHAGYPLTISYPVFLGKARVVTAINTLMTAQVASMRQRPLPQRPDATNGQQTNGAWHAQFDIACYRHELLSLLITETLQQELHAPVFHVVSVNYDLRTDHPWLLSLDKLFSGSKDIKTVIAPLLTAELHKQLAARHSGSAGAAITADQLTIFTLSATAITFIFPRGTLDADRDYQLPVPLEALEQYTRVHDLPTKLFSGLSKDPKTGLLPADAARLGMAKFFDHYSDATTDSTAGTAEAYWTYSALRATRNSARAAALLPPTRQWQYWRTRDLLGKMMADDMELVSIQTGDGTRWSYVMAEEDGREEEMFDRLIDELSAAQISNPAARKGARQYMTTAAHHVHTLVTTQQIPSSEAVKDFTQYTGALTRSFAAVQTVVPSLPDYAAVRLAAFVQKWTDPEAFDTDPNEQ